MSNECSAGFVLGQFQQCEPVPVLKVNIKTNPQSNPNPNSNLDSKLSGHYVSRWSNEKRQWTYVKNRDEKIHFYFDISTKFWNIQDSNSKSEISFSISSNISPITPGANCQTNNSDNSDSCVVSVVEYEDEDECATGVAPCAGSDDFACINTIGSFHCVPKLIRKIE
jgi:hypothetical protein